MSDYGKIPCRFEPNGAAIDICYAEQGGDSFGRLNLKKETQADQATELIEMLRASVKCVDILELRDGSAKKCTFSIGPFIYHLDDMGNDISEFSVKIITGFYRENEIRPFVANFMIIDGEAEDKVKALINLLDSFVDTVEFLGFYPSRVVSIF